MSGNDSASGGYLVPEGTPTPLEDAAFDAFFHDVIMGITSLNTNLIFPSWQVLPPNLPAITVNWCSFGLVTSPADVFASEWHDQTADNNAGADYLYRNETLLIRCKFYGPNAQSNASIMRDGVQISQNREVMQLAGMALIDVGDLNRAPTIVNVQWYNRYDLDLNIRRAVLRKYPVRQIASVAGTLNTDVGVGPVSINVNQD